MEGHQGEGSQEPQLGMMRELPMQTAKLQISKNTCAHACEHRHTDTQIAAPDEGQDEQRARQRLPELLLAILGLPVVLSARHERQQLTQHEDFRDHGLSARGGCAVHQVGAILDVVIQHGCMASASSSCNPCGISDTCSIVILIVGHLLSSVKTLHSHTSTCDDVYRFFLTQPCTHARTSPHSRAAACQGYSMVIFADA
eukprot:1158905-Pelagomonas_calceolata.AAC.9